MGVIYLKSKTFPGVHLSSEVFLLYKVGHSVGSIVCYDLERELNCSPFLVTDAPKVWY